MVESFQFLFKIKLFSQNPVTCDIPELGKTGPFPKEWSLLGDVFLRQLYLPKIRVKDVQLRKT
jgi:hypothetical protein